MTFSQGGNRRNMADLQPVMDLEKVTLWEQVRAVKISLVGLAEILKNKSLLVTLIGKD